MKYLPILALVATPVFAQDREIYAQSCEAPCVAQIVFHNRIVAEREDERVVTLETEIGTVHVWHVRRRNPTHDGAEVVDLPANFVAVPNALDLEEETIGYMNIYRFAGM